MTKKELIVRLKDVDDDSIIVCMDEKGGWDNIKKIKYDGVTASIVFGGGSPFSDE